MLFKLAEGTWPPFSRVTSTLLNGKNITLLDQESFMGKIIKELANQFNFSYEIVNQDENIDWGILDSSVDELRFNGMVGMIQRNEVDLGVGPFSIDHGHRYLVSNPSTIIMENELLSLSSGKNIMADQANLLTPLIKSFETWVWILSLITPICVSIITFIADSILYSKNKTRFMKSLENNLFFHLRSMTRQNIKLTVNEFRSRKMIHISWLLPSVLLSLFYSSMILAKLLASTDKPIHTINDIANAEDTMVIVMKDTSKELLIKEGQSDDLKRIYSRIKNKFGEEVCFVSGSEKLSGYSLTQTLAGKRILFETITTIKNLLSNRVKQRKSCGFHIGSTIKNDGYFMLFNKRFDCTLKQKIDQKLLNFFECKPFGFVINRGTYLYSLCLEENNNANINNENKPLSISNIHGLIIVCSFMIGLALIILMLENLLFHINLLIFQT